jgi:1,4-dihydroxy-2-naphthoate octaprenyltransferase
MTVRQFFGIVELRTKVISVSTYILATLYVIWAGASVRPWLAVLLAVAVLCVDMGTTAFNSFYDYLRGVDTSMHNREPEKVLVHEGVEPGHALIVSVVLYLIAVAAGVVVAWFSSWWIIPAGAACLLVGFLYNGGPLPISRTPLGELFAGGFLGSVLFLVIVGVHAGRIDWMDVVASLPSTLVIASVLTVNNTCDIDGDRLAGRATLSIVIGRRAGEALVYVLGLAAYGLLFAMAVRGSGLLLPADTLPALPAFGRFTMPAGLAGSIVIYVAMHRRGYSHETKRPHMVSIIRIVWIYTATYGGTLLAGILLRHLA